MALPVRQGATHKVVVGPVVDVDDGFTPITTLSVATSDEAEVILHDNGTVVDISGYTFAAIATADGYYHLTLQSGISNTVGHMTVVINDDSLCLPVKADFVVLDTAAYDAIYKDAAIMDVNVITVSGTSQTANDNGADINEILIDTGTTLENRLIAIEADTDVIDDGTSGLVKIASDVAGILEDTGTTIPATITTAQTDLDTITGADGVTIASAEDLTATMKTSVNTEVASALDAALPASPTPGSINDILDRQEELIIKGTATSSLTTTTLVSSDVTVTADDQFNGRLLTFRKDTATTQLQGQQTDITDSTASSNLLTFTALTTAPSNTDEFDIT